MCSRLLVRKTHYGSRHTRRILYPAIPLVATASMVSDSRKSKDTSLEGRPTRDDIKSDNTGEGKNRVFDITKTWEDARKDAREFWKSPIFTDNEQDKKQEESAKSSSEKQPGTWDEPAVLGRFKNFFGIADDTASSAKKKDGNAGNSSNSDDEDAANSFRNMASTFVSVLAGGGSEESIQKIVRQARESAEQGDVTDKTSLEEVLTVLQEYAQTLKATANKFLGDVDLSNIYPTNLFYYMEYEDSQKTPSWKRRMHRFYRGIDIGEMDQLNDYLQLAELSYADTVEDIRLGLENNKTPFEVVFVDTNSYPNRPAHFIAVKRSQPIWSPYLEVILCVRGTKSIGDALTDLLCDDVEYRGGRAHAGVLEGGQYLAIKHKPLLLKLLKSSGKHEIKLTLVGHSLGAGAASIIGMELNDDPDFHVEVIGFGCPALLSKELSESTKSYITTVIADNDCVPRLSGASVVNALLNIMEYDFRPSARRDVQHAIQELQRMFPMVITKGMSKTIQDFLDPLLEQVLGDTIKASSKERMETVLYPPGNIIHFYRDGVGVTGSSCPCDFFGELDINRRMVDDHLFFTGYQQIFLELMRQHHQDHNFSFENNAREIPQKAS